MSVRAFMEKHGLKENEMDNDDESAGTTAKPKLTEQSARDILREYPDADLTAFDTTGLDIEALARDEGEKSIAKLEERSESIEHQKRRAMEALGITSEEVEAGARFSAITDDADPRWQFITVRVPRVHNLDDVKLEGVEAQWRAMKYHLASAKGVIDMLMQTLPMHLVSALAMGGVSHALDMIGITLAAIDEKRREQKNAQH